MARLQSIRKCIKKPSFILGLIITSFFLKEIFLAVIFPIFTGQDEARHYNTVQYLAEPKQKTWTVTENKHTAKEKNDFASYNFSEEIQGAGDASGVEAVRGANPYDKLSFSDGYVGQNETEINSMPWAPVNKVYPPEIAGKNNQNLYHILASWIEKFFGQESILVRFYLIRIFSVFLGMLAIATAYFIFKNSGFGSKESLIMTAIISFQPKLSSYIMNINYFPLLFLSFALFVLAIVLSLKNGLNWKNGSLMLISVIIGVFTKGIALVLFPVLLLTIAYHIYKNSRDKRKLIRYSAALVIFLIILSAWFAQNYNLANLLPNAGSFSATISSLGEYLSKSLPKADSSAANYWGYLDWTRINLSMLFIYLIWIFEAFALVGIVIYIFSKRKLPEYLPEKKYAIFFLIMITALQFGVRLYDWKVFMSSGSLDLGTPGRYFLPSIIPHIALVFLGLGTILKQKKYFDISLLVWLVLMFSFSMYEIFNLILPRYYL